MDDGIFILLIGHGGSDINDVAEFLNLLPNINMANEENLVILQDDNPKIYAPGDGFSFNSGLAQRTVPKEYGGNKIIFSSYFVSAEQIIGCIDRETVIMHGAYSQLKILFLDDKDREPITETWAKNERELVKLRNHYHGMAFSLTFNDFLNNKAVQKELFSYLGISLPEKKKEVAVASFSDSSEPEKKPKKKPKPKAKVKKSKRKPKSKSKVKVKK